MATSDCSSAFQRLSRSTNTESRSTTTSFQPDCATQSIGRRSRVHHCPGRFWTRRSPRRPEILSSAVNCCARWVGSPISNTATTGTLPCAPSPRSNRPMSRPTAFLYRLHSTNSFRSLSKVAESETKACMVSYCLNAIASRPQNKTCLSPSNFGDSFYDLVKLHPNFNYWVKQIYAPYHVEHRTVESNDRTQTDPLALIDARYVGRARSDAIATSSLIEVTVRRMSRRGHFVPSVITLDIPGTWRARAVPTPFGAFREVREASRHRRLRSRMARPCRSRPVMRFHANDIKRFYSIVLISLK